MTVYCIDTSSLVEAAARRYPRAMFPALWELLEKEIAAGNLIATELVRDELERRDDSLYDWAKTQTGLFQEIDEAIQVELRAIVRRFRKMVASGKNRNMADPWVIALAKVKDAVVITEEQGGVLPDNPKIPLVCKALDLECINFLEWMRRHGVKFQTAAPV